MSLPNAYSSKFERPSPSASKLSLSINTWASATVTDFFAAILLANPEYLESSFSLFLKSFLVQVLNVPEVANLVITLSGNFD